MRAVLCLALMLLPASAYAAAGTWTAQMEDDEGGKVMVASVTADPDGGVTPELRVMCAGDQGVMLRYLTAKDTVEPGSEADFQFENESIKQALHMAYEDEDGAFAAYFPKTAPILTLLQSGEEVFISEASGNYAAQTFELAGSTKAIGAVIKGCKK